MTLKDKSMEVRLYHLLDNPREGTNLFAYVPRDRMLVQADLYDLSLAAAFVGRERSLEHRAAQVEGRQGRASPRHDRALLADGQDDQGEADGPSHIDRRRGWKGGERLEGREGLKAEGREGGRGWKGLCYLPPFLPVPPILPVRPSGPGARSVC